MLTLIATGACDSSDGAAPLPEAQPLALECSNAVTLATAVRAPGTTTVWAISLTSNPGGPPAGDGRALVSHDDGDSYDSVLVGTEPMQAFERVIPIDAERALFVGRVGAAREAAALATLDGGRTTTPAVALTPPTLYGRVAERAWDLGGVHVATLDGFAYTSRDGGAGWEPLMTPPIGGLGAAGDGTTNGDGGGRIVWNPDCGMDARGCVLASWDHGLTTVDAHAESLPPADYPLRLVGPPGHLLFGGAKNQGTGRGGIYTSKDGGLSWELVWTYGRPIGGWVDPRDDSAWIPLAVDETGVGRTLRMQLLVLHGWGERAELFDISAGGVPLLGMDQLRRTGDVVELMGTFAPSDGVRQRLACRLGPSISPGLDATRPALPLSAPPPGELALVARRFESTFTRTNLAFDPGGSPWVMQDNHLMGSAPPSDWWMLGFFDDWNSGSGPTALTFDGKGRLVVAQGPRQYSAEPVYLFELDPTTETLTAARPWDALRVTNEAGVPVVPVPRRLMQALGTTWLGTGEFTARLVDPPASGLADYRNAHLPGAGSFSPDGRRFAWVMAEAERYRDGPSARSPIMVGDVLDGRFTLDPPCAAPPSDPHPTTRTCADYLGEAWVVAVTNAGLVLVLDRIRGIVSARSFDEPAAPWTRVAEGLVHPTDLMVRVVGGEDVAFLHDGDVFAFTPRLGEVARRRLSSDAQAREGAPVVPYAPPSMPTSEDPFGCVPDHPCIQPESQAISVETLRVVPWFDEGEYILRGERLGTSGTLFVDGEPYPTLLWTETGVHFEIKDTARPDGELWIEVDGVASNHLRFSTPPIVERIEPATARPGDIVSIHGRNLGATQGDHALHNYQDVVGHGLVVGWSDTRVAFVVEGAQSGRVGVTVYKHGLRPAQQTLTLDVVPKVAEGCRSAREEPCTIIGASFDVAADLTVTVAGRPVEVLDWRMSRVTLRWPDDLEPGAYDATLSWSSGVTVTAPVVLERWSRARLGPMSPEGHNVGAHAGWLVVDGEGAWLTAVGFTIGLQGGMQIPGPPVLALDRLGAGEGGLAFEPTGAWPKYRQATDFADLPWTAVHEGELWAAGSAMSASVQTGPNGLDLLSDVHGPMTRRADRRHGGRP